MEQSMAKCLARIIQAGINRFIGFDGMELLGNMCIKLKGRKGFDTDSVGEFNYLGELRKIPGCIIDDGQLSGVYIKIDARKFTSNSLKRLNKLIDKYEKLYPLSF